MGVAAGELGPLAVIAGVGFSSTGLDGLVAQGMSDDIVLWRAQLAAAALAVGYVVLAASLSSFDRNPLRRTIGVRTVDAHTYCGVGPVRAVMRVIVRDAQFLLALALTEPIIDRLLAEDDLAAAVQVLGWVGLCRIAPLLVAAVLPRRRAPHDWLLRTVVIDAGEHAPQPRTAARLVGRQTRIAPVEPSGEIGA